MTHYAVYTGGHVSVFIILSSMVSEPILVLHVVSDVRRPRFMLVSPSMLQEGTISLNVLSQMQKHHTRAWSAAQHTVVIVSKRPLE